MAGRQLAPNPAGAHFLRDRRLIAHLASASGARTGGLVFDLGAGSGAITAGLAGTGARVTAVERDPKLAARLRRRFDDEPNVRVVEADLRTIPLPRRDFLVVASLPFSVTTALCRRLLGDPAVPLAGAELIVQWGAARKRLLLRAGLDPAAPVAQLTADQWHRLAVLLGDGTIGA